MNIPRYKFSDESKLELLQFLKVASDQKIENKFCNLSEYDSLNKLFPLDNALKEDLKRFVEDQNICIDITGDDESNIENEIEHEFYNSNETPPNKVESILIQDLNKTTTEDITYAIKENLETEKKLSASVIKNLLEISDEKLEEINKLLGSQLNVEDVIYFGQSLNGSVINNEVVIVYYIRFLLMNKLKVEFSDQLQDILHNFIIKYQNIVVTELTGTLLSNNDTLKVLLQYIDGLNTEFKSKLFGKFIFNCEKLSDNIIGVSEVLLGPQVEYDLLNKLIEIMSNSADDYSSDKSFGKLLMNVLQLLGKNLMLLEQPLKHIIASHKSIWKAKVRKMFEAANLENSLLSQSFK